MKVLLSPIVDRISGSVKSGTYQMVRGRQYIRTRPRPTQPDTAAQLEVRQVIKTLNVLWHQLAADVLTQWSRAGALFAMSGWNYFCKQNFAPEKAGDPILLTPPNPSIEPINGWNAIHHSSPGYIKLNWNNPSAPDNQYLLMYCREVGTDVLDLHIRHTTKTNSGSSTIGGFPSSTEFDWYGINEDWDNHNLSMSVHDRESTGP